MTVCFLLLSAANAALALANIGQPASVGFGLAAVCFGLVTLTRLRRARTRA